MTSNNFDLTDEFRSIAASLSALIEGLSYIDEDVAEKLAVEFSEKLVKATREVYIEMTKKMSNELAKPRKRKARRRRVATAVVNAPGYAPPTESYPDDRPLPPNEQLGEEGLEAIGREVLPVNPNSFLGGSPISLDALEDGLQDQLGGQEVTNRASSYPPVRDQGTSAGAGVPRRLVGRVA
ncbi:MAG: hypothetical protein IIC90_08865 [Chloroflexi bacterium]|nr:hypothetical protein [Chloroflexota bacterium]